ncbi:hypothetical protein bthur0009_29410 [Bacillus thuringiensis serovar andalousiensis BGSC 4AW1]|nr:hypothetical protein bthur0009_29410 [Bacillus thuringiensis serovar andalousiensis BGSC 4AW1]
MKISSTKVVAFLETKEKIEDVKITCIYAPYIYICCSIN